MKSQPVPFHRLLLAVLLLGALSSPPGWAAERVIVIDKNKLLTCPEAPRLQEEMLRAINAARESERTCGSQHYSPAPPVSWQADLTEAAAEHARDMAAHDFLSHTGSAGGELEGRVAKQNYAWGALGENVSGGLATSKEVVAGWLQSPGHCANIMKADFKEIGAACARNAEAKYGTYWTLVLASPRENR